MKELIPTPSVAGAPLFSPDQFGVDRRGMAENEAGLGNKSRGQHERIEDTNADPPNMGDGADGAGFGPAYGGDGS